MQGLRSTLGAFSQIPWPPVVTMIRIILMITAITKITMIKMITVTKARAAFGWSIAKPSDLRGDNSENERPAEGQ